MMGSFLVLFGYSWVVNGRLVSRNIASMHIVMIMFPRRLWWLMVRIYVG